MKFIFLIAMIAKVAAVFDMWDAHICPKSSYYEFEFALDEFEPSPGRIVALEHLESGTKIACEYAFEFHRKEKPITTKIYYMLPKGSPKSKAIAKAEFAILNQEQGLDEADAFEYFAKSEDIKPVMYISRLGYRMEWGYRGVEDRLMHSFQQILKWNPQVEGRALVLAIGDEILFYARHGFRVCPRYARLRHENRKLFQEIIDEQIHRRETHSIIPEMFLCRQFALQ